jgi:hypothetical protein
MTILSGPTARRFDLRPNRDGAHRMNAASSPLSPACSQPSAHDPRSSPSGSRKTGLAGSPGTTRPPVPMAISQLSRQHQTLAGVLPTALGQQPQRGPTKTCPRRAGRSPGWLAQASSPARGRRVGCGPEAGDRDRVDIFGSVPILEHAVADRDPPPRVAPRPREGRSAAHLGLHEGVDPTLLGGPRRSCLASGTP